MLFILLLLTGILVASFGLFCGVLVADFLNDHSGVSKRFPYLVTVFTAVIFILTLVVIAILSPLVGEGRPNTSLIEEGRYKIVAVGQIKDDRIELLLAKVEHVSNGEYGLRYYEHESRYYRLSVKKLGLTTFGEELEGQWIVVKKLRGYGYKILPEVPLDE